MLSNGTLKEKGKEAGQEILDLEADVRDMGHAWVPDEPDRDSWKTVLVLVAYVSEGVKGVRED